MNFEARQISQTSSKAFLGDSRCESPVDSLSRSQSAALLEKIQQVTSTLKEKYATEIQRRRSSTQSPFTNFGVDEKKSLEPLPEKTSADRKSKSSENETESPGSASESESQSESASVSGSGTETDDEETHTDSGQDKTDQESGLESVEEGEDTVFTRNTEQDSTQNSARTNSTHPDHSKSESGRKSGTDSESESTLTGADTEMTANDEENKENKNEIEIGNKNGNENKNENEVETNNNQKFLTNFGQNSNAPQDSINAINGDSNLILATNGDSNQTQIPKMSFNTAISTLDEQNEIDQKFPKNSQENATDRTNFSAADRILEKFGGKQNADDDENRSGQIQNESEDQTEKPVTPEQKAELDALIKPSEIYIRDRLLTLPEV